VDHMIEAVKIDNQTTVMEIGCGDGFLSQAILSQSSCKELRIYEIDPEWAAVVQEKIRDPRMSMNIISILDFDWSELSAFGPLVMLANLPYQITFPIFFRILDFKE